MAPVKAGKIYSSTGEKYLNKMIDSPIRKNGSRYKALAALFISLALSVFLTTRPFGVDRDCYNYLLIYEAAKYSENASFDIGFSLLAHFFSSNGVSFFSFSLIITATSLLLKIRLAQKLNITLSGILFYIICILPIHEYTQIRASLALALGYYALYLSSQHNRILLAVAFLSLSSSIHMSAATLFIPFFQARLSNTGKIISTIALLLLAYLLVIKFPEILITYDRTSYYDTGGQAEQKLLTIQNLIFFSLLLIGANIQIRSRGNSGLEYYLFCLIIFTASILLTEITPVVRGRLLELSFFSYIIWISRAHGLHRQIAEALLVTWGIYALYRYVYLDGVFDGVLCNIYTG